MPERGVAVASFIGSHGAYSFKSCSSVDRNLAIVYFSWSVDAFLLPPSLPAV